MTRAAVTGIVRFGVMQRLSRFSMFWNRPHANADFFGKCIFCSDREDSLSLRCLGSLFLTSDRLWGSGQKQTVMSIYRLLCSSLYRPLETLNGDTTRR
jgi:hypothetical protein